MFFAFDMPGPVPTTTAIVMIFIGLGLAFLGRKIIKILVFLGAGMAGAGLALKLLEPRFAEPIPLIGMVVAFIVMGFIGLGLMKFAFALMLGIVGYLITMSYTSEMILGILGGAILFVVGWLLFKYYLSIATAFAGAAMVFSSLEVLGVWRAASLLIAIVVGVAGAYVQFKQLH